MSKQFKFELNRAGVSELMKSEGMQGLLNEQANNILVRAGEGFARDSHVGSNRANSMVYADSPEAYFKNLKHNTLLKAIK